MDFITELMANIKENVMKKLGVIILAAIALMAAIWATYHWGSDSTRAKFDEKNIKAEAAYNKKTYTYGRNNYKQARADNENIENLREKMLRKYHNNSTS